MQEAEWEAMGRSPDLANLVAAAAEGWAFQGCKLWCNAKQGSSLGSGHRWGCSLYLFSLEHQTVYRNFPHQAALEMMISLFLVSPAL